MKLLATFLTLASSQLLPQRPDRGFGAISSSNNERREEDFIVIPKGYEGSFQNFNITKVYDENKNDDIFNEIEDLSAFVESGLGRTQYSDEQKSAIRKFKLLKNMIVYLQLIPIFGKFCFYGCYCFTKAPFNLIDHPGNGKPMDRADNACKRHSNCHKCATKDFEAEGKVCDIYTAYKFEAVEDPVTAQRHISCLNDIGSCKRAACECDVQLAYDLKEAEMSWNILMHKRWGKFNQDNCLVHQVGGRQGEDRTDKFSEPSESCCGQFPFRFPYHPEDGFGNARRCCGNKTYNPNVMDCCSGEVLPIGSC